MNKLLPVHKVVLVICLILLALQAGLYLGLQRPRRQAVETAEKELQRLQGRLSGKAWPRDGDALRRILAGMRQTLKGSETRPGLHQQADQLLGRASRMYEAKIFEQYGSKNDFINSVSRLDYQEEYNRLVLELKKQGINLSAEKFNLAEDTSSAYNYQLMLQLWTVEKICALVKAADLQVLTNNNSQPSRSRVSGRRVASEQQNNSAGACISVLPMAAYFQEEKSLAPYLLEFPVAISLRAELPQLQAFVNSLHSEDTFLALKKFEIKALPPTELLPGDEGKISPGVLDFSIICAGFFTRQTLGQDE